MDIMTFIVVMAVILVASTCIIFAVWSDHRARMRRYEMMEKGIEVPNEDE